MVEEEVGDEEGDPALLAACLKAWWQSACGCWANVSFVQVGGPKLSDAAAERDSI